MAASLTAGQARLLLRQVNRVNDAELLSYLPDIAGQYPLQAARSPRLLFLYCKRDVLDLLTGDYWEKYATEYGDEKESQQQQFDHLKALRGQTVQDIDDHVAELNASGGAVYGLLTTQHTIERSATDTCADPNDRAYAGDPIRRIASSVPGGWR